jgi:hypothetical protein
LRLWEAKESKAADLTRGIAWILSQPIYSLDWSKLADVEAQQIAREDVRFAQNNTRLNGLRMWGKFLGFLWEDLDGPTVDPTLAVRDNLPEILPNEKKTPIRDFIEELSTAIPVLDQGEYRLEIEKGISAENWAAPPVKATSTSLSRALLRLRREKVIDLLSEADTGEGLYLLGPGGSTDEKPITHVRRHRGD